MVDPVFLPGPTFSKMYKQSKRTVLILQRKTRSGNYPSYTGDSEVSNAGCGRRTEIDGDGGDGGGAECEGGHW